ncbi:MAG TPA: hypothetical protein ENJ53_09300 [Phaeodactylibacter sp.]|nr:hypothetical protein [Phaeodactylibacter sp.]
MSNFWNKIFLGFILFLATTTIALAQPRDNAPYTRLGLGDLTDQYFFPQAGMGGLGAAYHDFYNMNISNPASYSHLRSAAFEIGMFAQYNKITDAKNKDNTATSWTGDLGYLSLGFPLKNPINEVLEQKKKPYHWGMNFTLLPYSVVNYNILEKTEITYADSLTAVDFLYQGTGGTYKVMWGNSMKYKNFSVGLNLGYFFGNISNNKNVNFRDFSNANQNRFDDNFSVGGLTWNVGAQYDFILETKKDADEPTKYVTIGAYGNTNNKYTLTRDRYWRTVNFGYQSTSDTIPSVTGSETIEHKDYLPAEFSIGVMYVKVNKLRLGADFKIQSWKEYTRDLVAAGDENKPNVKTWRAAIGGEYLADANSYNNFLKKVRYRFGAFYGKDPRSVQNDHLLKYGVTFGMGMPITLPQQKKSFVNFGLELGQIGLADALKTTYFKINLGFTLNDNTWFLKRKFN